MSIQSLERFVDPKDIDALIPCLTSDADKSISCQVAADRQRLANVFRLIRLGRPRGHDLPRTFCPKNQAHLHWLS